MKTEIKKNVYLFRYNKRKDELFEGNWPIIDGISINAYLVIGSEKKVLIDYNESGASFDKELSSLGLKVEDIDAIVLNHIEPDHTGALKDLLERNKTIQVYGTTLAANMVKTLYGYECTNIVKTGDTLDLGGKTLEFFATPNIHWPETMMTYLKEDKILFSCDAFGAFGEYNSVYDSEMSLEEWQIFNNEALRYYSNIVAPFSSFVLKGIETLKDLDIKMICPSHGILWKEDLSKIINMYIKFANYKDGEREKEIALLVSSMYGNTESMIEPLLDRANEKGIKVNIVRIPREHESFAIKRAWKSEAIVVAAPTYERELFPSMANTLDILRRKGISGRTMLYFGSSLWSGGGAKEFLEIAEKMDGKVVDAIEFRGRGKETDREMIMAAFDLILKGLETKE